MEQIQCVQELDRSKEIVLSKHFSDEHDDLLDYDEDVEPQKKKLKSNGDKIKIKQGSYVGIHSSGFKDFLLKPELMRSIVDCGFEHPSQVQFECVPQAILGMDIICQAKSGMGKTAVFVLATLHQLEPVKGEVSALILCHTRELAFQINNEFKRFTKYMDNVKSEVFYGGVPITEHRNTLKNSDTCPNIVIGTPGRLVHLAVQEDTLKLGNVKHFILDECDKLLEEVDMRRDVQRIFMKTPHEKQVMMFSATLAKEIRPICKKFCQEAMELYVDDEAKLTLHGLQQYYLKIDEKDKNKKLSDLLDTLEFNQVIIFVSKVTRAKELNRLLVECSFPSICAHSRMKQEERIAQLEKFKNFDARILVSTDLLGRGIDIERVNIVINYDFPDSSDSYLHRVNRAGRFGTKGLAISYVATPEDIKVLDDVQSRFEVKITPCPDVIDVSTYMNA